MAVWHVSQSMSQMVKSAGGNMAEAGTVLAEIAPRYMCSSKSSITTCA